MKKIVWMTVIIGVLFVGAVCYGLWSGVFADEEPQTAKNAVASIPLSDDYVHAGLLSYEHFNDTAVGKVPDRYLFLGNGDVEIAAVPAETNTSLRLIGTDSKPNSRFMMREMLPEQADLFTIELKFMQPEKGEADVLYLSSGDESVLTLKLEDGVLRSHDDAAIYSDYKYGEWLAVKVVTDVKSDAADVYVNGLPEAAKISFSQSVEQIDGWGAATDETALFLDDIVIGPGKLDFPVGFAAVGLLPTGGMGGESVTVTNVQELIQAVSTPDPKIVYVEGDIDLGSTMVKVQSDKTIIGIGDSAVLRYGGLRMQNVKNVIIRNLHFVDATDDAIEVRDESTNIWIDHNTFTRAYDGAVDIRKASDFVTVSWNYFYDQGKTSLVGSGDNDTGDAGHLHVTYYNNRFDDTNSRNPMVRFGEGHILNNLYQGVRNYAVRAYTNGSLFVEGNAFYNTRTPMEIVNGELVERNNLFENSGGPVVEGDVFDPFTYYTYPVLPAESVLEWGEAYAGAGKIKFSQN